MEEGIDFFVAGWYTMHMMHALAPRSPAKAREASLGYLEYGRPAQGDLHAAEYVLRSRFHDMAP